MTEPISRGIPGGSGTGGRPGPVLVCDPPPSPPPPRVCTTNFQSYSNPHSLSRSPPPCSAPCVQPSDTPCQQPPPPWPYRPLPPTPPPGEMPTPPPKSPPPGQVLTDSGEVRRIRSGCSRLPVGSGWPCKEGAATLCMALQTCGQEASKCVQARAAASPCRSLCVRTSGVFLRWSLPAVVPVSTGSGLKCLSKTGGFGLGWVCAHHQS